MKSYIKNIILFNEDGEKRSISFKQGVNIISGESKTGKSAIVEIIDYCLCSSSCTVPKGKITDFTYLYVMVLVINDKPYVIARYNPSEKSKMHFIKENSDYNFDDLELSYFDNKSKHLAKDVQVKIEHALGLFVTNIKTDFEKSSKKASLRNMVSYLFQHQNLIASKFALFYRFNNFYKMKDTIDQFPVFAGFINQEYYSDVIKLNKLQEELKKEQKKLESNKKSIAFFEANLKSSLSDFYALLGKKFNPDVSFNELYKKAIKVDELDDLDIIENDEIVNRYSELKTVLEDLRNREQQAALKIKSIEDSNTAGSDFNKELIKLKEISDVSLIRTNKYVCPLCGNECNNIVENDIQLMNAQKWLEDELKITSTYTNTFSEDIRKLSDLKHEIELQIKPVYKEIKDIEKNYIYSEELKTKQEKINYAKAKIKLLVEMHSNGIYETTDEDIEKLKSEVKLLEQKVKSFNLDRKKREAESIISNNMNRLAKTLDFEEEYGEINLHFCLSDNSFNLYHEKANGEKIYLDQMGSGANWISCHIALFLSMLRYFSMQEDSPMLLTMFFDQPSQVYFPQGYDKSDDKQSDLVAVSNLYSTIFNEIKSISEDTNVNPQLIIVDHVDGKNLTCSEEFKSYVCCNWRNNEALI